MKILHSSDFHLVAAGDERWAALEETVNIAVREKVDVFVISGDLFDSDVDSENLRTAIRGIFSKTKFETFIIPGNHDSKSFTHGLYFGENIHIHANPDWSKNIAKFDDFTIIGIPFEETTPYQLKSRLKQIPEIAEKSKPIVLIYHGELLDVSFDRGGFGPEAGRYMPSRLEMFEELDIDYVLAGHFHQNFTMRSIGKNKYFIYPGSPVSITKKETGERNVALVRSDQEPKSVGLDSFHYIDVEIRLDAFKSLKPMTMIKKQLDDVVSHANVLLTVSGTVSETEQSLVDSINLYIKKTKAIISTKDFLFRDISKVMLHPVFQIVDSKILELKDTHGKDLSARQKEMVREIVVSAMVEAGL